MFPYHFVRVVFLIYLVKCSKSKTTHLYDQFLFNKLTDE